MTDKESSESRRKLLKTIAAGGGAVIAGKSLPESWSRPVVDSVILPAHAQTSARIYSQIVFSENEYNDSLFAKAMDMMVPTAEAQERRLPYVCISILGNIASVAFMGPAYNMIRRGNITLDENMGGFGQIVATNPQDVSQNGACPDMVVGCGVTCLARPAKIQANNEEFVVFGIKDLEGGRWVTVKVYRTDSCGPEPALTGMCY